MTSLLITGCKGRMGQALLRAAESQSVPVASAIDLGDDFPAALAKAETVIDFTSHHFADELLRECLQQNKRLVFGTTGHTNEQLAAIRENEDSAKALGINVFREKVKVMLLSGAISGMGGCFFAQYFLYIDPLVVFGVDKSVEMLLVSMIGGAGTVYGPLVGALLLASISDITRVLTQVQGLSLVLYGSLLVVIIAYLPNGLIDLFKRRRKPTGGQA